MRRNVKTLLVLSMMCTLVSFFMVLSSITLKDKSTSSLISKQTVQRSDVFAVKKPLHNTMDFRYKPLFDHAVKMNFSRLLKCHMKTEPLILSKTDASSVFDGISGSVLNLFVPKWQSQQNKSRYFLSAIVRLRLYKDDKARWTVAELKQWIHYQLWAGAEHIYICNHYLNKEEMIMQDLEKYSKAGLVTVLDWSQIEAIPGSKRYQKQNADNQVSCYNHVKDKWGDLSTWMYTFDMDENPFCPQDQCEGFLTRFLKSLDNGTNRDVGLVLLPNFVMHGQGDRSRDIHYDRINRITPKPPNGNVKSIFRTIFTARAGMHSAVLHKGRTINADALKLKMLHYWGARSQKWGPDTKKMLDSTLEFNDVRETIAIVVRHSLLAFGDFEAFNNATGP